VKEEELKRCLGFLEYFGVKKDKEFIYVNDVHTSIICNPNTEWKDFLGHSILEVVEAVGKELQLKIKWA